MLEKKLDKISQTAHQIFNFQPSSHHTHVAWMETQEQLPFKKAGDAHHQKE